MRDCVAKGDAPRLIAALRELTGLAALTLRADRYSTPKTSAATPSASLAAGTPA